MSNKGRIGHPLLQFDQNPERIPQIPRRIGKHICDDVNVGVQYLLPIDLNMALSHTLFDTHNVVDIKMQPLLE